MPRTGRKGPSMAGPWEQIQVFSGNSNPGLVEEICDYLSIPVGRAEVFKFSNDNTFVRIGNSVRQDDVFVVQSFTTPVNDSIMELLIMIDTLKRSSAGRDRKSTRLNSSHVKNSYAVFCLKKKK